MSTSPENPDRYQLETFIPTAGTRAGRHQGRADPDPALEGYVEKLELRSGDEGCD